MIHSFFSFKGGREWVRQHPKEENPEIQIRQGDRQSTRQQSAKQLTLSQGGNEVVDIVLEPEQTSVNAPHISPSPRTADASKKALQMRVTTWGTVSE